MTKYELRKNNFTEYLQREYISRKLISSDDIDTLTQSLRTSDLNAIYGILDRVSPDDNRYARNAAASILSGYADLERKDKVCLSEPDFDWVSVKNDDGSYYLEDPAYVCVLFNNDRHIPLPLILGSRTEDWAQNLILDIADNLSLLQQAQEECDKYEEAYFAVDGNAMDFVPRYFWEQS